MARSTRSPAPAIGAKTQILALVGPEATLKRDHLDALRAALEEAHGQVDTFRYDGAACALADVLDELRSYSLLQQHKIVIVDNADTFVSAHRAALERYTEAAVDSATLVLRADRWNSGKLDKLIAKVGAIIKCAKPSVVQAQSWLVERSKAMCGRALSRQVAARIVARIGPDLGRAENELGKLALLAGPEGDIDEHLVDQLVGSDSQEQAYAVQEALLASLADHSRRCTAAIEKIHELLDVSRQADVLVVYFVADLVRKLHQGFWMMSEGMAPAQIARQLRFWGSGEAAFTKVLGRLDARTVQTMFDRVVQIDIRGKSSLGPAWRNLERVCVQLKQVAAHADRATG